MAVRRSTLMGTKRTVTVPKRQETAPSQQHFLIELDPAPVRRMSSRALVLPQVPVRRLLLTVVVPQFLPIGFEQRPSRRFLQLTVQPVAIATELRMVSSWRLSAFQNRNLQQLGTRADISCTAQRRAEMKAIKNTQGPEGRVGDSLNFSKS